MFSSRNRTLWQSLGFRLTAWFAGFFVLGFSLLLFVYSFFINTSLENSDRQAASLIASELKHVAEQGGLEALRTRSLALDNSERTDSFLVGLYNGKTTLFLKTPEKWREFDVDFASFGDEFDKSNQLNWQILPSQKSKDSIELLRTRLSDGRVLVVGQSNRSRRELLERFISTSVLVLLLVFILAIAGGAFLATRALSPLRRFISTVQSISAGEMTARVPLTGTKDELYLLSELFNEMLDRVSALIRGMRDSLDHVAHDIRTPLTRLRASVEMALVSEKYEVQHDALLTCYEESERIQNMLRLLLDITAAETGVLKLNLEKVDVVAFLDDLMDFFQMFVDEKKQQFVLERSEVKEWTFDRGLVFQTLVNVLENAFKYTPVEGRIVLRVFEKNSELCFEVEDNGIGILDIDMPRIFDRLFRGNLSRSEKGMGLGLSLVKAFVGAHKGEVRVKSEPEKGSVFTVSLPSF